MKNVVKIILLSYNIVTYLLVFLIWNKWETIWHEYFVFFIPKLSVFVVPVLLAFSSIFLICLGRKSLLGWVIALLGLLPIEYVLYMKNFVYIYKCSCSRLYPFLDTEIHFSINTVMLLFIILNIVLDVILGKKLNNIVLIFNSNGTESVKKN